MKKWQSLSWSTKLLVIVLGVLLFTATGLIIGSILKGSDWEDLALNLGTEIVGAILIYVLLVIVVERSERVEAKKTALIVQLASSVNDVAKAAADELRRRGWLHDGSLKRADLSGADLSGADFFMADLSGADLFETKLRRANLNRANLSEADLTSANLSEADLSRADLFRADLFGADLVETKLSRASLSRANLNRANLSEADLTSANLSEAKLTEAILTEATFRTDTVLPDGTRWTPDVDMAQFTKQRDESEDGE